jgi:vancomycin resistance protein YoaR
MTKLEPPPLRLSAPGRGRLNAGRWLLGLAVVLVLAAAVFVLGPPLLTAVRADVLPGTTVDGVDVGGLDEAGLHATLEELAASRGDASLGVRRALPAARTTGEPQELRSTAGEAGYALDVEATAAAVLALGRQADPRAAWADHLQAFRDGHSLAAVEVVDDASLTAWAEETAAELAVEPIEGTITLEGTAVARTEPEPGVGVDAPALAEEARGVLLDPARAVIDAPTYEIDPVTTTADVDAVEEQATRALSGPVELSRNDGTLVLTPDMLAGVLTVAQRDEEPRLALDLQHEALRGVVDDADIAALERDPVDAEIRLEDGEIIISESTDGFRFDASAAAEQVLSVATGEGPRSATLEGRVVPPDLSTDDARGLGIVEPTGTFTTHFTAGQSRVQNIRRIAELVNGVVLQPGESLSVNEHVGERTVEKGFAPGGAILEGEFVEQIGGGVSQFATTLYNAAYFGGYELVRYQAHSYYIDRYPMGREATLDYPTIDLEIRNNSPHGLLIEATTTASSVTVTTWGTPWVEVESDTSAPFNRVGGRVRDGFDVVDTRILRFPDGREEREERFTRYRPED